MKRILLAALALAALVLTARYLFLALASDETKITWLIEEMEEGFDEGRAGTATSGLARDWSHGDSSIDRDTLRALLAQEFLTARQSSDRALRYRVEIPETTLEIEVEGDSADLRCEAVFESRRGEEWSTVWRVSVEVELRKGEGEWEIHASRHEDLEGRGLRR
jgi:hypothetical protein